MLEGRRELWKYPSMQEGLTATWSSACFIWWPSEASSVEAAFEEDRPGGTGGLDEKLGLE